MARRWLSTPALAGFVFIIVGILFITVPNAERAVIEYRSAMAQHVWSTGVTGPVETGIGTIIAVFQAAAFTFAAAVVSHPVLTLLFGVGGILLGLVLLVEYGLLYEERKPWRDEWDM